MWHPSLHHLWCLNLDVKSQFLGLNPLFSMWNHNSWGLNPLFSDLQSVARNSWLSVWMRRWERPPPQGLPAAHTTAVWYAGNPPLVGKALATWVSPSDDFNQIARVCFGKRVPLQVYSLIIIVPIEMTKKELAEYLIYPFSDRPICAKIRNA